MAEAIPAYKRQLERNKRYYDNNKAKVLQQQKEYKDAKPLIEKSREMKLNISDIERTYYIITEDYDFTMDYDEESLNYIKNNMI